MTDREALAAALDNWDGGMRSGPGQLDRILAAAHKYLAQLPEKCAICNGDGFITYGDDGNARDCEVCHGSGKVYPAELVERIADTIAHAMSTGVGRVVTVPIAVAVLDALNGTADG